eukprot:4223528-Prorocentrum_lima.AAC.1
MTSSLVGSEMCIRDRPPHVGVCEACSLVGGGSACGASPGEGAAPLRSVSYTHLTLPTICSV